MNKTILFVDDDADDRDILADILKNTRPCINAVFAENGLEAIKYLTHSVNGQELPCLVVLDLNMPFLDGRQTFRIIKNELKIESIPVIIFTSSQSPVDEEMFTSLGVKFITKPDNYSYFENAINYMVNVCCNKVE